MMSVATGNKKEQLEQLLSELAKNTGSGFTQKEQHSKTLSIIDALLRTKDGISYIYDKIPDILMAGIFRGTNWANPKKLVPSLVKGTLCGGFPLITYESLSELRILFIAEGKQELAEFSQENAIQFLKEAIIGSFSLAFGGATEEVRLHLSDSDVRRLQHLFQFILARIPIADFKEQLAKEVLVHARQRPMQTEPLEKILSLVKENIALDGADEPDQVLGYFVDTLFHPTLMAAEYLHPAGYAKKLSEISDEKLESEAGQIGEKMRETGLVSQHQIALLHYLASNKPEFLPVALSLNAHGKAEFESHTKFVLQIIQEFITSENKQVALGLSNLLNRNLISRKAVKNALKKLCRIEIHPKVAKLLLRSGKTKVENVTANQLLSGGAIHLLGQPLGVGQGLNPTCQSARGLSMWSRHSPEKLLNKIIEAASANQLHFRYEGELISSEGLVNDKDFDLNLDPVSVVLVPHLDNIYQKMMQRAMKKHPQDDPHVSVNPAFYGHWIQTGFISCYKPLLNAIQDYETFAKYFYAAFHPKYNGGFKLIYPIPLGIFITSSQGDFLGFHAVSLLRVKQDTSEEWRAYFFNPNNEGRQNWGQGISPSVFGYGEKHGESSLPFHQFASRVYAFHYNSLEAQNHLEEVDTQYIRQVQKLAKDSWGRNYTWL